MVIRIQVDVRGGWWLIMMTRKTATTMAGIGGGSGDGQNVFDVASDGKVRLLQTLDFDEGTRSFSLNVTVKDVGGLSSHAIVRIDVKNVNDNPPVFDFSGCSGQDCILTEYKATVEPNFVGQLNPITPNSIKAQDADLDPISYRFLSGSPVNYSSYLQIDETTGLVTLSQPVDGLRIGHFSVIVEALDVSPVPQANGSSSATGAYNSATCVLLVMVSGRETNFPAVIGHSSHSNNRDAWFISAISLACLCAVVLILLVVLGVWLCCLRQERQKLNTASSIGRPQSEMKSKMGGALMRSVHSDSERKFIRELSATEPAVGKDNPAFQDTNGHLQTGYTHGTRPHDDDVFVTDIESYFSLQGVLQSSQRSAHTETPELIAFQDALPPPDNGGSGLNVPSNIYEVSNANHLDRDTRVLNPRNLQSQYKAIDLLTSVVPLKEEESSPFSSFFHHSGHFKEVTFASSSAGTCRSMRDVDVIGELQDLMAGRRTSSPIAPPSPLALSPHINGYLPEGELDNPPSLDEAITPFPSSPTGKTSSPCLSVQPDISEGVKLNLTCEPTLPDEHRDNRTGNSLLNPACSTSTNGNRYTSSIQLTTEFSLTNLDNVQPSDRQLESKSLDGALDTTAEHHSLGFEPTQPEERIDSSKSSTNQKFFVVSL
ncbi:protocadherin 15 [Elysia marginata]|uniref:Protocadherin 15 n=1 Tax=Elysia marginata TaxID=1093978 RepID=A0AAV4GXE4_9GAST|nr:protocadherin 15 [Elysia marginata]